MPTAAGVSQAEAMMQAVSVSLFGGRNPSGWAMTFFWPHAQLQGRLQAREAWACIWGGTIPSDSEIHSATTPAPPPVFSTRICRFSLCILKYDLFLRYMLCVCMCGKNQSFSTLILQMICFANDYLIVLAPCIENFTGLKELL